MNYFGLLRVNQFSYRQLLEDKVFPPMKQALGLTKLRISVWRQDGGQPQQAKMVTEWLETIFQEWMLAIKCLRGDTLDPYSLEYTTHVISFFGGT